MKNQLSLSLLILFISTLSISCKKEKIQENSSIDILPAFEKTIGGAQNDVAKSILIKNNELYIFGTTKSMGDLNGDHYLVKTDLNGTLISEHIYGGALEEEGIDIIETNDGNFILLGSTASSGAGQKDIHVIKIDNSGNIIWEKTYGGLLEDTPQEIIELSNNAPPNAQLIFGAP